MAPRPSLKQRFTRSYLHLLTGILLLVTSVLYLWLATNVRVPPLGDPIGPRFFPLGLGSLLLIFSALMLGSILWRSSEQNDADNIPGQLQAWAVLMLLVGFVLVLPKAGFLLSSTAFATLVLTLIRFRSWPVNVLTAVLIAGSFHIVFRVWLGVPLPSLALG
ncbi:tripartite tricarboxylate transporter TctB family protein [Roseinatronobacter bogoriensis]|uniref:Tripartite tricarboxylate transporter TctB family protein n=1 Tax=Roseinatronobacter bogoriensis subsp. barguzinensis TaxID=441209 RepID=A0A2K8KDP4_9RHOB|nr:MULTISPECIES: tripartite tricarboxylate transporter TctB family protein [Rhodobaca]ATX67551.1 tripartite tricarboxylate transporter TctB family protein [Rhodobaca barguzinensis]MBB4209705.1 putative tricarboxylic transport membrane protein [Rhodobaca bogoriensis DSM 18756]TDW33880.1 putative tricarboxylic transport membrane protein [Rhodobaca barguzinensis]TDY66270.1 putative tricarboxylic transport membrane protein [Rhodobaca bogoriensis DSM 18756]